jgi:hypothetical protein
MSPRCGPGSSDHAANADDRRRSGYHGAHADPDRIRPLSCRRRHLASADGAEPPAHAFDQRRANGPVHLVADHRNPAARGVQPRIRDRDRLSPRRDRGRVGLRAFAAVSLPDTRSIGRRRRQRWLARERGETSADRRADLLVQRGAVHPGAHDRRRAGDGLSQLSSLHARRQRQRLVERSLGAARLPLHCPPGQQARRGGQHQPRPEAARAPPPSPRIHRHSRCGLCAGAAFPQACDGAFSRPDNRGRANAAAFHQPRSHPDQPRRDALLA